MRSNPLMPIALWLLTATAGCGSSDHLPSQADIDWAQNLVSSGTEVAGVAEAALQALGLLPVYECEEPRATFISRIAGGLTAEHPCVTAEISAQGAEADALTLTFTGSCSIDGVAFGGVAVFTYAGGEGSMELAADLSALTVGGQPVGATAGYATCGDEQRFFASGQGAVPGVTGWTYALDVTVAMRDGLPVIGGTTLIFSGTASLTSPAGTDEVTFQELEYEIGDLLPKSGSLRIETSTGRVISARFSDGFLLGEVEITIDGYDPVSVPIL